MMLKHFSHSLNFILCLEAVVICSNFDGVEADPIDSFFAGCPNGEAYCCSRCASTLEDCFNACGEGLVSCPCPGIRTNMGCRTEDVVDRDGNVIAAAEYPCCGKCVSSIKECSAACGNRCPESSTIPICPNPERTVPGRKKGGPRGKGAGVGAVGSVFSICPTGQEYCCTKCAATIQECIDGCSESDDEELDLNACQIPFDPDGNSSGNGGGIPPGHGPSSRFIAACPKGYPWCCTRCAFNLNDCYDACGGTSSQIDPPSLNDFAIVPRGIDGKCSCPSVVS